MQFMDGLTKEKLDTVLNDGFKETQGKNDQLD